MKLVYVKWQDSRHGLTRWQFMDEMDDDPLEVVTAESVGFVLREDDAALHIAANIWDHEKHRQFSCDIQIPKSAILDLQEIVRNERAERQCEGGRPWQPVGVL